MKKLMFISTAIAMSFSLAGCNTMNDTARFAGSTVGTGIKYTATTVGSGIGFIGDAVGTGVGTIANTGVGLMGGHPVSYNKTRYNTRVHTVYHNGHRYMLQNGKYVRIN